MLSVREFNMFIFFNTEEQEDWSEPGNQRWCINQSKTSKKNLKYSHTADDGPLSASPQWRSAAACEDSPLRVFFFIFNLQHFFFNQRPKHSHFTLCISIVCELYLKYVQKKRWLVQKAKRWHHSCWPRLNVTGRDGRHPQEANVRFNTRIHLWF